MWDTNSFTCSWHCGHVCVLIQKHLHVASASEFWPFWPRFRSLVCVCVCVCVCFCYRAAQEQKFASLPIRPAKILLTTVSNRCQSTFNECVSVMWSETVGLTDQSDQKIALGLVHCGLDLGLGLADLVLFCET